ncbi:MAG: glycolate oxidase subunit GlcF [Pseudomonadota bacterium]
MQINLASMLKGTVEGDAAEAILQRCVHCGFCNATCPTYQLLGNELDGPRGRIYLIKQMLEGQDVTRKTQVHLDRCLSCRACETTCPSGVQYHRLLDIGRAFIAQRVRRPLATRMLRGILCAVLPRPRLFSFLLRLGQAARPFLPRFLATKVPLGESVESGRMLSQPLAQAQRTMLLLTGCVQPSLAPQTNAAARRVLRHLGIELMSGDKQQGCCGAVRYHLDEQQAALQEMRRMIDAWWPLVEDGRVEAIVITASGCGAQVRDYAELLRHDALYAEKAACISALTRDIAEIVTAEQNTLRERLSALSTARSERERALGAPRSEAQRVAFHSPCTLQHGQAIRNVVEPLLTLAGYDLTPVTDAHLCCGSAGTYSILQAQLSEQLRDNKLKALKAGAPTLIATANIGCQMHLQAASDIPVRHWIELLDACLSASPTSLSR